MEIRQISGGEVKYSDDVRNINGNSMDFLLAWKLNGILTETSWISVLEAKNTEVRRKLNGM